MREPDGVSKGCAFIKFKTKEEALLAMRFVNGNVYIGGSDKPMEVRFAENKKKPVTTTEQPQPARTSFPTQSTHQVPSMNPAMVYFSMVLQYLKLLLFFQFKL